MEHIDRRRLVKLMYSVMNGEACLRRTNLIAKNHGENAEKLKKNAGRFMNEKCPLWIGLGGEAEYERKMQGLCDWCIYWHDLVGMCRLSKEYADYIKKGESENGLKG